MITLADILDETAPYFSGGGINPDCTGSQLEEALRKINRATQLLMNEGMYEGTTAEVCLEVCNCCLTLDYRFETILAYLKDNREGTIDSISWKYSEMTPGMPSCCGSTCDPNLIYLGNHFATHRDLTSPSHLLITSDRPEDADAKITIQGEDENRRPIRTGNNPGGTFSIKHSLNSPSYTSSDGYWSGLYSDISSIQKGKTKGVVTLWAYNPFTQETTWISSLMPEERSPSLTRYKVPGSDPNCCSSIRAHVRHRYIPLTHKSDVALIQNRQSYVYMIQSITAEESGDLQNAAIMKRAAIGQLEKQETQLHRGQRQAIRINNARYPGNFKHHHFGQYRNSRYYNRQP